MKSYRFNKVVDADGSVRLSGLPPQKEAEIVVLERAGLTEEMQSWLDDIRARHPFAKMTKEEILEILRQTRETVWDERHRGLSDILGNISSKNEASFHIASGE